MGRIFAIVAISFGLASCASRAPTAMITPTFTSEQAQIASQDSDPEYSINALDLLSLTVFQVEDLSVERLRVDASGKVQVPLLGVMQASGRTASELSEDIRNRLAASYLQNPRVTVAVVEGVVRKVTVDGAVVEPGVYEMKGPTTLMQAVAMAKGPTRVSDLENVVVFRTIDGQRMVAVFDLQAMRNGQAQDIPMRGDDMVFIGTSRLSVAMREIVAALPALAFFRPY